MCRGTVATGAEYTSRIVGIKAAFQGAGVSDNIEEASNEEALSVRAIAPQRDRADVPLHDHALVAPIRCSLRVRHACPDVRAELDG